MLVINMIFVKIMEYSVYLNSIKTNSPNFFFKMLQFSKPNSADKNQY